MNDNKKYNKMNKKQKLQTQLSKIKYSNLLYWKKRNEMADIEKQIKELEE